MNHALQSALGRDWPESGLAEPSSSAAPDGNILESGNGTKAADIAGAVPQDHLVFRSRLIQIQQLLDWLNETKRVMNSADSEMARQTNRMLLDLTNVQCQIKRWLHRGIVPPAKGDDSLSTTCSQEILLPGETLSGSER